MSMTLNEYECVTTFWQDFTIADKFGLEAIKDTFNRAFREWRDDRIYGTELAMILNHKCWFHFTKPGIKKSQLYKELFEKLDSYVLDNWQGEDLKYYLKTTD